MFGTGMIAPLNFSTQGKGRVTRLQVLRGTAIRIMSKVVACINPGQNRIHSKCCRRF